MCEGTEYTSRCLSTTHTDLAQSASEQSDSTEETAQPEKSEDEGLWYTDKQGIRCNRTKEELETARKLGYLWPV